MFQFNPDNKVLQVLSQYFDLTMLALLWLVTSIPIVTIGVSTTAAYRVLLKLASGHNVSGLARTFFGHWHSEWKRSTLVWMFAAGMLALVAVDLFTCIAYKPEGFTGYLLWGSSILAALFVLPVSVYIFPVNAQFQCTVKQVLTNSLRLAAGKPVKTLMLLLLWALMAASMVLLGFFSIIVLGPLLYVMTKVLYKAFQPVLVKYRAIQPEEAP